jgi:O-acetyl-ADP-ribose deacetylase (regulator of RNase III)
MIQEEIKGDLLEAPELYITQQCNCLTVRSHGLSDSVSKKYPWANVYGRREPVNFYKNCAKYYSTPGTIQIDRDPTSLTDKKVIHLFAQWAPGKAGVFSKFYPDTYEDTYKNRLEWFAKCISLVDELKLDTVAVPYLIGCGLAGGRWESYREILENAKTNFVLYKI